MSRLGAGLLMTIAACGAATPPPAPAPHAPALTPPAALAYAPTGFTAPRTAHAGKLALTVTPCRLDVAIAPVADDHQPGGLAIDRDGRIYVLDADGTLRRFTLTAPCDLHVDRSFTPIAVPARDHVEGVAIDGDGRLYVSRFDQRPLRIDPDGKQTEICGNLDAINTEPGATATVVDGRVVDALDGACDGKPLTLEGWTADTPRRAWPFGGDVALVNSIGDGVPIDYLRIFIHTLDGKKQLWLAAAGEGLEQLCSVEVVWPCGDRVCVGDRGCSSLHVWGSDGTLVGVSRSEDLVGLREARPFDAVTVGGASLMLLSGSVWHPDETWTTYPLIVRIDGL